MKTWFLRTFAPWRIVPPFAKYHTRIYLKGEEVWVNGERITDPVKAAEYRACGEATMVRAEKIVAKLDAAIKNLDRDLKDIFKDG